MARKKRTCRLCVLHFICYYLSTVPSSSLPSFSVLPEIMGLFGFFFHFQDSVNVSLYINCLSCHTTLLSHCPCLCDCHFLTVIYMPSLIALYQPMHEFLHSTLLFPLSILSSTPQKPHYWGIWGFLFVLIFFLWILLFVSIAISFFCSTSLFSATLYSS